MKRLSTFAWLCGLCCLCVVPVPAFAQTAVEPGVAIVRIQTGAKTASDEVVELYNPLSQTVAIGSWQIRFQNTDSTSTTLLVTIDSAVQLPAHSSYMLHTASVVLPSGMAGQQYRAGLSNKNKLVALFTPNATNCRLEMYSAVRWQEVAPGAPQTRNYASSADVTIAPLPALKLANCLLPAEPSTPATSPAVAVRISELLPNPTAPNTDAADEFIELYNPADQAAALAGYTVVTGLKGTYHYALPADTAIPSQGYLLLYSAVTHAALANSGGQVRLLDPHNTEISQSAAYPAAADGQSWAYIDGGWQWTSNPSPNADNTASPPAMQPVAAKKTSSPAPKTAKASTAKSTVASAKTTKSSTAAKQPAKPKASTSAAKPAAAAVSAGAASSPLHPGVLAVLGVVALLYGLYEYRHDLANKIHQFRTNRAARRAARQAAEGR